MEQSARLLTLHIGAHKTGTSVFQNHVFPSFPGYIGKYQSDEARDRSNSISNRRGLEKSWLEVYRLWVLDSSRLRKAVRKWIEHLVAFEESSVLVSSEEFHSWPARGNRVGNFLSDGWLEGILKPPHPFIFLLEIIREESWGKLQVQVVFTIRNQVDYLGSRYVQGAGYLRSPSQADFGERIQRVIQTRDPSLDWEVFIKGLQSVVGRQNVLPLVYEDGLEFNLEKIMKFLRWEGNSGNLPQENVRRVGSRSWSWTPRSIPRAGLYGKVFWFLFARVNHGGRIRLLLRAGLRALESLWKRGRRLGENPSLIEIDDEIAQAVLATYSESNSRLSGILGRDLSALGYLPQRWPRGPF